MWHTLAFLGAVRSRRYISEGWCRDGEGEAATSGLSAPPAGRVETCRCLGGTETNGPWETDEVDVVGPHAIWRPGIRAPACCLVSSITTYSFCFKIIIVIDF
jgi:hypothetical protein